jgi:hypothetical protein
MNNSWIREASQRFPVDLRRPETAAARDAFRCFGALLA